MKSNVVPIRIAIDQVEIIEHNSVRFYSVVRSYSATGGSDSNRRRTVCPLHVNHIPKNAAQVVDRLIKRLQNVYDPCAVGNFDACHSYASAVCHQYARFVASTKAGLTSSVLAGLSALKGPLHGGAPGPVLDMLDAIGTPDRAETWLRQSLDRGERLMGFGHRIYRVRDPRADALKGAVDRLAAAGHFGRDRFALVERVETEALRLLAARKPDRVLQTNVEFYTALLLEALGFPRATFTSVFAAGRVAGWIAHAREQALYGRLIRPQSRYVGPSWKTAA